MDPGRPSAAAKLFLNVLMNDRSMRRAASLNLKDYGLTKGNSGSFSGKENIKLKKSAPPTHTRPSSAASRSRASSCSSDASTATLHATFTNLMKTISDTKRNHIAVRFDSRTLTFGQLARLSDCVAAYLQSKAKTLPHTGPVKIAFLAPRSIETIPIIFGMTKMGAAAIPVDPQWTVDRIQIILTETRPHIFICDDTLRLQLDIKNLPVEVIDAQMFLLIAADYATFYRRAPTIVSQDEDSTAVILYDADTLQSYEFSHKLILHRLAAHWDKLYFTSNEAETVLVKSPFTSINILIELFGTLLGGQTALFLPVDICSQPAVFIHVLETFPVRRLLLTPTELNHLLLYIKERKREFFGSLKLVMIHQQEHDALSCETAEEFFDVFSPSKLGYSYAVGELAGEIAWCIFDNKEDLSSHVENDLIPVGTPISPELELLVLDDDMQPVTNGTTGKLFVNCNWLRKRIAEVSVAVNGLGHDHDDSGELSDMVRTGRSAFIEPKSGFLYIIPEPPVKQEIEEELAPPNPPPTPPPVHEVPMASEEAVTVSVPSESATVAIPTPVFVAVHAPDEMSPELKDEAVNLLLSGILSSSDLTSHEENLHLRSQLAEYALTIFEGMEPREFVFIVTDDRDEACGIGMAYDPFEISADLKELMHPMKDPRNQLLHRILKPLTRTLPQSAGCIVVLHLMSVVDDTLSDEEKFSIYSQIDEELEKRARRLGYQFIMTTNFDVLMQKVSESRGYQRWAKLQLNRLCLSSGIVPFDDKPDTDTMTLDVLPLIRVPMINIQETIPEYTYTRDRSRSVSFGAMGTTRMEYHTVDSFVEDAANWLATEMELATADQPDGV
ncbi:uncharacterized protein LOC129596227 [Paramacrobiotus metropolitanus]|uniref:uncharacterized protein LOC129596227 n=1 Tax=Paramacrobiotus metropolitanus TaxID=2943436 RepID=UPI0024463F1F|nr:uncharacterized protein LOC129596227 [Paramacrobiotus metropolitanus]